MLVITHQGDCPRDAPHVHFTTHYSLHAIFVQFLNFIAQRTFVNFNVSPCIFQFNN